ncbi:MAG: hypothetical protein KDD94_13985 [Calditrichaeota bacterium]|nr:hypothetical protein [Calditrichota bacterium]
MFEQTVTLIVFTFQVLFLSYLVPLKTSQRLDFLYKNYSPEEYPKLYTRPIDYYHKQLWIYRFVNQIILLCGLVLIAIGIILSVDLTGKLFKLMPIAFGMIEMIPLVWLERMECNQYSLMRQLNQEKRRTAELKVRRFFDYISPSQFALLPASFLAAQLMQAFLRDFDYSWGSKLLTSSLILLVANIFLSLVMLKKLYGKKRNPYQDKKDRSQEIEVSIHAIVYICVAMNLFYMMIPLSNYYQLNSYEPLMSSLYFQVITFASIWNRLKRLRLDEINFDVYRNDISAITNK